jgi:hypothetical protein
LYLTGTCIHPFEQLIPIYRFYYKSIGNITFDESCITVISTAGNEIYCDAHTRFIEYFVKPGSAIGRKDDVISLDMNAKEYFLWHFSKYGLARSTNIRIAAVL